MSSFRRVPTGRQLLFVTASKPVTPQSVIFSNSRHLFTCFRHQGCFGTGLALITVRKKISPMKSENPFLAALVLIGTSLLARMAAQGVKQALFSTAMEYCLNARRRKLRSVRSGR